MYYSQNKENKPILTFKQRCDKCGQESKFLLQKHETSGCIWIIPYWGKDYFITCGNCFTTSKIDKKTGEAFEESLKQIQKQVNIATGEKINIQLDINFKDQAKDKKD